MRGTLKKQTYKTLRELASDLQMDMRAMEFSEEESWEAYNNVILGKEDFALQGRYLSYKIKVRRNYATPYDLPSNVHHYFLEISAEA